MPYLSNCVEKETKSNTPSSMIFFIQIPSSIIKRCTKLDEAETEKWI
jgi:hypothetical protein